MSEAIQNTDLPVENVKEDDGVTWWCKILVKVVGVVAAIISVVAAVPNLINIINPLCIISACLMILNGALLLLFEAPVCCSFVESAKKVGAWIEKRRYWHKGIIYIILAALPIIPYRNLTIIFGCVPVFATGTFYGMLSLGKKADRNEMMTNAESNNGNKYQPFHNEPWNYLSDYDSCCLLTFVCSIYAVQQWV